MKRLVAMLCLVSTAAHAQFFTPNQINFLDARYGLAFSALTTNTIFAGTVTGPWNNLSESDPFFFNWLATNPVSAVTADTTTITNNGSGQFSVKNYDTNAIARTIYLRNARDTLQDYLPGHVNSATLGEMTNGGVLAQTLGQLLGP